MREREIDDVTGTETTGHEWDGIKELNSPLPAWWLWTFYATIIWAIGYMIAYPAIPLINSATSGVLGYSSRADVALQIENAQAARAEFLDRISAMDVNDVRADSDLFRFSLAAGASAFKMHCSQCHGSGAQGSPGYPNLNDDDWIWGGTLDDIYYTILHGVRYEADDDTRLSEMSAFGEDDLLQPQQISESANYVLQLANLPHDGQLAQAGAGVYEENCAACHGDAGEGDREQGAPRLNDAIWLYGNTISDVTAQITAPDHGVMPGWRARLGETTVKQLAIYVHSLGGGE